MEHSDGLEFRRNVRLRKRARCKWRLEGARVFSGQVRLWDVSQSGACLLVSGPLERGARGDLLLHVGTGYLGANLVVRWSAPHPDGFMVGVEFESICQPSQLKRWLESDPRSHRCEDARPTDDLSRSLSRFLTGSAA
ncbi:MAG: PilZ domain-containing protein [Candidatus Eremiobacteraeota bacterium]|nr:PilZ domain-containing protein [Candidatus Eremiobacteraeota bacterium]